MRRLILMRHAQAIRAGDLGPYSDERRWLTEKGRQQARQVGALLAKGDVILREIVASPLVRTVQTAELVASAGRLDGLLRTEMALAPDGRLSELLTALEGSDDGATVLAVGHEPTISAWAAALSQRVRGWVFEPSFGVALDFQGAIEPGVGQPAFRFSGEGRALEAA